MSNNGMHKQIGKVRRAFLGWEDHGIFTCYLDMNFGGTGQGVGFYALDEPRKENGKVTRHGTAVGLEFVIRLLQAFGVNEWKDLEGRTAFVLREGEGWNAKAVGIEPLPTEEGKRFIFSEVVEA